MLFQRYFSERMSMSPFSSIINFDTLAWEILIYRKTTYTNQSFKANDTYINREACHLTTNPSSLILQIRYGPLHNHMLAPVHPLILYIRILNRLYIIFSREHGLGNNRYLLDPYKNLNCLHILSHKLFALFSSLITKENNNHGQIQNTNLDPHIHIPYIFAYIFSSHQFLLLLQGNRCKGKDIYPSEDSFNSQKILIP